MKGYAEYRQCADCKKIYKAPPYTPYICKKCGSRLLEDKSFLFTTEVHRTDKCNLVIAKKTLFGWKVREVVE